MKHSAVRIAVLTLVILAVVLSVLPQRETNAVNLHTTGIPSVNTHSRPERATWADAFHYVPVVSRFSQFPVMCFDPLLTSTVILDVDGCGRPEQPAKVKHENETQETVITETEQPEQPVIIDEGGETVPSDDTPSADADKKHCNKGEGNGGEGCDPGNHPERGNDDENQSTPKEDKSKKNK